jgi:hypothetical protein
MENDRYVSHNVYRATADERDRWRFTAYLILAILTMVIVVAVWIASKSVCQL